MAGDVGDAVSWLVNGGCRVRRAGWDPSAYVYLENGEIRAAMGEHIGGRILATSDDLLADDWEPVDATVYTGTWGRCSDEDSSSTEVRRPRYLLSDDKECT